MLKTFQTKFRNARGGPLDEDEDEQEEEEDDEEEDEEDEEDDVQPLPSSRSASNGNHWLKKPRRKSTVHRSDEADWGTHSRRVSEPSPRQIGVQHRKSSSPPLWVLRSALERVQSPDAETRNEAGGNSQGMQASMSEMDIAVKGISISTTNETSSGDEGARGKEQGNAIGAVSTPTAKTRAFAVGGDDDAAPTDAVDSAAGSSPASAASTCATFIVKDPLGASAPGSAVSFALSDAQPPGSPLSAASAATARASRGRHAARSPSVSSLRSDDSAAVPWGGLTGFVGDAEAEQWIQGGSSGIMTGGMRKGRK
jgi:hypothetical protein